MRQVSISQARQHFPSLIESVYYGDEVLVTKHKIPIAKIVPLSSSPGKMAQRSVPKEAFGLWKDIKGKTTVVARKLRKEAWVGNYAR